MNASSQTGDLQQQAYAALQTWVARANALFADDYGARFDCPQLAFDLRGRVAGLAVYASRKRSAEQDLIRLNPVLLERHPTEMIEDTIPHELAHLVAHRMFGPRIKPHGREWRAVMAAFGKAPEVAHRMQVEPSRQLRRFLYHCNCPSGVELTSIRHKRARRGTGYRCRKCGQRLRWSGEEVSSL